MGAWDSRDVTRLVHEMKKRFLPKAWIIEWNINFMVWFSSYNDLVLMFLSFAGIYSFDLIGHLEWDPWRFWRGRGVLKDESYESCKFRNLKLDGIQTIRLNYNLSIPILGLRISSSLNSSLGLVWQQNVYRVLDTVQHASISKTMKLLDMPWVKVVSLTLTVLQALCSLA